MCILYNCYLHKFVYFMGFCYLITWLKLASNNETSNDKIWNEILHAIQRFLVYERRQKEAWCITLIYQIGYYATKIQYMTVPICRKTIGFLSHNSQYDILKWYIMLPFVAVLILKLITQLRFPKSESIQRFCSHICKNWFHSK